jgi:DNA-directed RNA polymerase specialized sigma24 family protein
MMKQSLTHDSLDSLAEKSLAGDSSAQNALFSALRVRFLAVAKRRVREDEMEDVAQEALRIVHARYGERDPRAKILPWSFAVLRNVIGNYYQARARDERRAELREELKREISFARENADAVELRARVARGIALLGSENPRCGVVLRRLLESLEAGGTSREVSNRLLKLLRRDFPGVNRGNFYVILHRCRARLREILEERATAEKPIGRRREELGEGER